MNDLEATLNALLADPKELEKLAGLAGKLLGGEGGEGGEGGGEAQGEKKGPDANPLSRLAGRFTGEKNDKGALVKALSPYLSPQRRARLERAVRLAGMLRLAGAAIQEFGGETHV